MKKHTHLAVLLLLCALPLQAQQAVSPEALARAQQLLLQVGREKAALEAEMAQVLGERSRLVREVDRLRGAIEVANRNEAQQERTRQALAARLDETTRARDAMKVDLGAATKRIAALERELAQREETAGKLTGALTAQTLRTNDVTAKNRALVDIVEQLMDQLSRKRGVLATWIAKEPVTGIGEVDIENSLQAARTRLLQLGVRTATDPGIE